MKSTGIQVLLQIMHMLKHFAELDPQVVVNTRTGTDKIHLIKPPLSDDYLS